MSVLIRFAPSSRTTTEQYDESVRRLQDAGDFPPEGMEYHVCFLSQDGNVRVSEILGDVDVHVATHARDRADRMDKRCWRDLTQPGGDPRHKRLMGFEPTTFCMASRRSSQLSYSRANRILAWRLGFRPDPVRCLTDRKRPPEPLPADSLPVAPTRARA